ncbi:hypothetical protein P170DRAFT_71093 [Aspergillus steynii IBT 23096]|uniref:Uncharacterized protein n=1 Tax=Aspergillus steynii IBT 23096 TaxID=1392250 RepID=A0A2I2FR32_9EURO|nr:uncharacterized protein P170DRAFT_71093 [Aspergillus steynii IBT 23096]PLB43090.1 hypothetical protein P170DRAFT_71093 [Aspergillus steynii IBT 23096]
MPGLSTLPFFKECLMLDPCQFHETLDCFVFFFFFSLHSLSLSLILSHLFSLTLSPLTRHYLLEDFIIAANLSAANHPGASVNCPQQVPA